MTSSADALAAVLVPLLATLAPLAPPRVEAPAAVEARVVSQVARAWSVPESSVGLAWGLLPAGIAAAAEAPLELVGRGSDGWFAVVLRPAGAPPLAVRVRAGVTREVAVAARPLPIGTTVTDDDVRLEERRVWGPPRIEARGGAGWKVRRRPRWSRPARRSRWCGPAAACACRARAWRSTRRAPARSCTCARTRAAGIAAASRWRPAR